MCHWRKSLISHSLSFRLWPTCPLELPPISARTGSATSMVVSGSWTSLLQLNSTSVYIIGYEKLASKVEPKWFLDVTDTSEQYQLKKRGNLSGLVKQRLYFLFFFGETAKFPALQKVTHNWKFRALPEISHCTIFHRKLRGWLQGGNKPLFSQHSTPIVPQDCAPLVAQRNDLNCTFGFLCWSMFPNIVQRSANIPHLSPYFHTTVPIWQLSSCINI